MSVSSRAERSLVSHEEYEIVRRTHHPDIYDATSEELREVRKRIRDIHSKEQTLARQKRRVSRGKAEERGGSFPGTYEHPARRKQVFAAAVKRLNKELERRKTFEERIPQVEFARKALALRSENFIAPAFEDKTADDGMTVIASRRRRTSVHPATVGRVSQRTKAAQARRDSRS